MGGHLTLEGLGPAPGNGQTAVRTAALGSQVVSQDQVTEPLDQQGPAIGAARILQIPHPTRPVAA